MVTPRNCAGGRAMTDPKLLCPTCAFWVPYDARVKDRPTTLYRCTYGVTAAPRLFNCAWYQREPGSDDE